MPELPEVETIRQDMINRVKGKRIVKVEVRNEKNIRFPSPQEFKKRIEGRIIEDIKRRGKYLLVALDSGDFLVFHLKLTGRLLFFSEKEKEPDYVRIVFFFEDKTRLFFADIRGFADVHLLTREEMESLPAIKEMGPEPLSPDFTLDEFKKRIKSKKGRIKPLLMDQKVIAGIGNIYSQESLYRAKVHPEKNASKLTDKEIEAIYKSLLEVLEEAIKYRGSSVDAYLDLEGKEGGYVPHLKVYGREGERCLRCGAPIKKKKIGGRGTYFCDNCQK
ncbi:MAG TPA: DNA-formamidopyrimidine glycosylase [Candidatus Aerophobetes bacterium]|uniref:Formamidopyrimidine-DNA glycosylase n=1 Tax=Aerophobetes bacterium TaxID=2030807 RepID=A0A7V5HZ39_UNCAE|nr:DNA-formamidopyrimidine glycosylase [Candidatus Aerophobetes bacterium]